MKSHRVLSAAAGLLVLCIPAGLSGQERLVLAGATLIDGTGSVPRTESRIVILDGRFACVSGPDGCVTAPGDREVDVSGTWITPGLIDTHAHLDPVVDPERTAEAQALRFALGITTVRDAGSLQLEALLEARGRASAPDLPVPRIVISARPLELYAESFGVALGGELVRLLLELGVDAIKIKDHISSDLWEQEISAAVELGVPVWGHVLDSVGPPPAGITAGAVEAGLTGISHLNWIAPFTQSPGGGLTPQPDDAEYYEWLKGYWQTTDSASVAALIDHVVRRGVWLEPLLATEWYWWDRPMKPPPELFFLRRRPPSLRDLLAGRDELAEPSLPTFPAAFDRMTDFVRRFHEAGGMLVTGTDELRPGLGVHAEMAFLRGAGLTPLESLQAATRNAAIALGRQDLGTVEVGKVADAVIYTSDPLDPAGTTLNVREIVKGGIIHESSQLLDEFRTRYRETVRGLWIDRALRLVRLCVVLTPIIGVGLWTFSRVRRLFRRGAA